MSRRGWRVGAALAVAAGIVSGLGFAGGAAAQQKEVIIGGMCDRTGPTQINGVGICPGIQDYYELVNSKGGVEGYRIKYVEIDHEYKVPAGVEAYQTEKRDGAVAEAPRRLPTALWLFARIRARSCRLVRGE